MPGTACQTPHRKLPFVPQLPPQPAVPHTALAPKPAPTMCPRSYPDPRKSLSLAPNRGSTSGSGKNSERSLCGMAWRVGGSSVSAREKEMRAREVVFTA